MAQPSENYVKVFATNPNDKILMLKRRETGTPAAGLWDFPGGLVETQEQPLQALKREVYEETKLALKHPHFLFQKP